MYKILSNLTKESVLAYIKWMYLKVIGDASITNTKEVLDRVKTCKDCFEAGKCTFCGCNFEGILTSRKDCERWKK